MIGNLTWFYIHTCRQPHPKPCVTQSKWTWSGFDIAMSSFASSGNFSKKGEGVFSSRKTKQKHIQQMKITLQIFIYFSYFCRELHYTLHGWNLATISQKEKQQGLSEKKIHMKIISMHIWIQNRWAANWAKMRWRCANKYIMSFSIIQMKITGDNLLGTSEYTFLSFLNVIIFAKFLKGGHQNIPWT